MLTPRFFTPFNNNPQTLGEWLIEDKTLLNHLLAVRVRVGQKIALINQNAEEWHAEITKIEKKRILCDVFNKAPQQLNHYITKTRVLNGQPITIHLEVNLYIAMIAQQNLDFLLQKATELGVHSIQLLETQFSQNSPAERIPHKMQHWQHILQHACEQSGRNHLPQLLPPQKLKQILLNMDGQESTHQTVNKFNTDQHTFIFALPHNIKNTTQQASNIYSHQTLEALINKSIEKHTQSLIDSTSNHQNSKIITLKLNAYIGPEGGFSEEEEAQFINCISAQQTQIAFYSLGQQILRSETAALAFLSSCYFLS